jgi:hypothetical protein
VSLRRALRVAALLTLGPGFLGCPGAQPIVTQQTFSAVAGSLQMVAVVPFYPRPELAAALAGSGTDGEDVTKQVTAYVADGISAEGVRVVAPSDVALAFTKLGHPVPRRDPLAAAELASQAFGATSVVLGDVWRWREREGSEVGAQRPASVGFQFALYEAPSGRQLWRARFDHTQHALTADPLTARRYPGGGSRWLTAAALARWGASSGIDSMVSGQWRPSN